MNNAATHFVTNVAAWVEHEEIIVVSFLKKALRCMECETETIITVSFFGVCIVEVIVQLSQISQCAQLISCCE
jgi:hypothetical protein